MEIVSDPRVEDEKHKNMENIEKTFVSVGQAGLSGKHEPISVTDVDLTKEEAAKASLPSLPQDAEVKDTPSLPTGKSEITSWCLHFNFF